MHVAPIVQVLACLVPSAASFRSASLGADRRAVTHMGAPLPSAPRPSVLYRPFVDSLPNMSGKTIAVTGASRGLGYVTALALAEKGARVLLLARPSSRASEAEAAVAAAATGAAPRLIACDLLDFDSVRDAAVAVGAAVGTDGLDGLCCNAGIMLQPDAPSADGYDVTAQTNVLSHFLLAREAMPALEAAAAARGEARVVTMSSGSGFGPPAFEPRYLSRAGGALGGRAASYQRYHQSKLANLLFTDALAERLAARGSRVMALACTPGVCATDMFAHVQRLSRPGRPVDLAAVPSAEDGCLAQLRCLCDPEVRSGQLHGPRGMGGPPVELPMRPPSVLLDDESKAALWASCEQAVGVFDL
jgi:NAD(P)-dependent dehydrogenase (short-subunit alcohol dehydrogenase family)